MFTIIRPLVTLYDTLCLKRIRNHRNLSHLKYVSFQVLYAYKFSYSIHSLCIIPRNPHHLRRSPNFSIRGISMVISTFGTFRASFYLLDRLLHCALVRNSRNKLRCPWYHASVAKRHPTAPQV